MSVEECIKSNGSSPPKNKDQEISRIKRNLIAGFKACGVLHFNPQEALQELPENGDELLSVNSNNTVLNINESLTEFLKTRRYGEKGNRTRVNRRGKRMIVEPGKSITNPDSSSSEEEEEIEGIVADEAENEELHLSEEDDEPFFEEPNSSNVKEGSFILVKFLGGSRKKTEFKFVCVVQEVLDEQDIKVMGMRKVNDTSKVFRAEENDISVVPIKDVIPVLPTPLLEGSGDRIKYCFQSKVDVKER